MNPTTESGDGAIVPYTTSPNTEGLTPYEQWKRQHGYVSPSKAQRLEIGQRVKATRDMDNEIECWDQFLEEIDEPQYVPAGTEGKVQEYDLSYDAYRVSFANGVIFWCQWLDPNVYEDHYFSEIAPVGKSPSQIAAEKAEQERLSQYRQLSLFDAQRGESEAG